jgi:hypothetical protein
VKRLFCSLHLVLAAMLLSSAPTPALAQSDMEFQPGVVVSLANIDEHLSDVEHLMEAAGVGQMAGLVRMGAAEYIRGIDTSKPLGAMLFFNEENPEKPDVLGFIPVNDIEDVKDTLMPFVDIDEDGDDIILTANDGTKITTRVVDNWAFMTESAGLLENLPANPAGLLGELPGQYNIAARVWGQRIPESLRTQAIELIKSGAASEMDKLGDGPEAELQRANFEYSMAQMESFINETEEVLLGFAIDEEGQRLYLDVQVVGLEGSKLALQSNEFGNAPATRFAGFLKKDAAATFHMCGKFLEDDIEQMQKMVDNLQAAATGEIDKDLESGDMSDAEAETARKLVADLFKVLRSSLDKGYMDIGGTLLLEDTGVRFAMGMGIAEGASLEASVKEIARMAEAEGAPVQFRFDIATEDGIRYHEVTFEVPDSEEEMRNIFGEKVNILLGVGDDVLYAGMGDNAKSLLAEAMNATAAESEDGVVGQFNLRLVPILKFVASLQDAAELQGIADLLPEDADDRIRT